MKKKILIIDDNLSICKEIKYNLQSGADDFVVKPFVTEEYLLRSQALIRQTLARPSAAAFDGIDFLSCSHFHIGTHRVHN